MPDHRNPMLCPIVPLAPTDASEPTRVALGRVSTDIRLLHALRRQQVKCIHGQDFIDARAYEREIDALACRIDGFLEALSCVGAISAMVAVVYHRAAGTAQRPINVDGPSGGTSQAYNDWRTMVERLYVDSATTVDDVHSDA
ncbi:MAG: hypothetical protein EPN70_10085 [Paraburkholderia sp.]|uniref:hypothetical protein n=1 Tax=Paraburkholderia sp. TaxID=1926495 RepID=UPI0011FCD71A|nr:hypothetical protein [Paraburkholderia sp.]TAM04904.1 MAG: hypothetical protein EPN70_10085 [Paraburkholderia sp.]TAM29592.1 MAG: hypothetical protein EPN59_11630 [Paraburkholderia sp.]